MIDSHVHFWDLTRFDYEWLNGAGSLDRSFLPHDLAREAPALDGIVFVQADCAPNQARAEVRWVLELAAAGAPIQAMVGHVALERGRACADDLAALAGLRLGTGARRLLQDEPAGFAIQPDFVEGVRSLAAHGLSMDLCIRDWQLPEVTQLVSQSPEVVFVLDHLAKPTVARDAFAEWAANLGRLAALPNVYCKISGLASEAPREMRNATDLAPWITSAIDAFGPERCMYGSDWPVVTTAGGYQAWVDVVSAATSDLTASEVSAIMGDTALAVYHPTARNERRAA